MCPPASDSKPQDNTKLKAAVGFLSLATVALLVSTIVLAVNGNQSTTKSSEASAATASDYSSSKASSNFFASDDANVCAGAKLAFDNQLCADLEVPGPQAGGNVTKGVFRFNLSYSFSTISSSQCTIYFYLRICWRFGRRRCSKYQTVLPKLHVSGKCIPYCRTCFTYDEVKVLVFPLVS